MTRTLRLSVGLCVGVCVLGAGGCGPVANGDEEARAAEEAAERQSLIEALDRGEPQDVIVVMREDRHVRRTTAFADAGEGEQLFVGEHLPIAAVRLRDRAGLTRLERMSAVEHVEPMRFYTTMSSAPLELIGQPVAEARGATGDGVTVAIVDTGLDYTHPDFGACESAGAPGCSVVLVRDFATSDGQLDDGNRHGTNVSAIVHAVAPSARLIGLDVFAGPTASSLTIISAIDWLIANRAAYNIVTANFSLGYGGFMAPCPADALAVAMQRLRDAGVLPVVASGNSGYANAISSPACAPAAVSVGAVDNSGSVASFSNSASFLSVLAPGVGIAGGGVVMSGTSQATPHVAGSLAALRGLYASETPTETVRRMSVTGVATTDARNRRVFRRLNFGAAASAGDIVPPSGSFAFGQQLTKSRIVPYSISATDPSGVASMCMNTGTTCTTFTTFTATGSLTFPAGDGVKTVRLWLRDGVGNTTASPLTASVTIDATPPSVGTLMAVGSVAEVALTWNGATDPTSGIARYRVVFANGAIAPASCFAGTLLAETTAKTYVHAGLTNGQRYGYRVCAVDRAENVSAGATATAMPVPETVPPSGTVLLAEGAVWSKTATVVARLTASDASGVASMCLSGTTTCSNWTAFNGTATVPVNFAQGSGSRVLYAWFRDIYGNTTPSPASDTILVDTQAPPSPSVAVVRGSKTVSLSWTAVADVPGGSGLAGYRVTTLLGGIPASCEGGTQFTTTAQRSLVVPTTTRVGWRVCAFDVLGNPSTGTYGTTIPLP